MPADYMQTWERQRAEAKAKAKAAILAKTAALKKAGVLAVVVEFRGDGDEGSIERVKYFDAMPEEPGDEPAISEDTIPKASQVDEDDFYNIIPDGFDQNEGSSGTVVVDLEAQKITVNIGWNYIETREESEEV